MTGRGGLIDIRRAVIDEDYYAKVRARLRGDALLEFERAVDEAWCGLFERGVLVSRTRRDV